MSDKREQRERIEISAADARQEGIPPSHAPKSRRTPPILIAAYALGLGGVAVAFWLVLLLVR